MRDLCDRVVHWADERGLLKGSDSLTQARVKTQEELDELIEALTAGDRLAAEDAYGDLLVTLIVGATCGGYDLEHCLEQAVSVIEKRSGRLVDGVFVKDEPALS
jgi:NTP pyrophosphatase (non-canonical NTP hydrolase)